jgi:DNA polymerase V
MFGLIDGNSFYCSCERAFDPKLRDKPVVVLSNNDGCVIARTAEAKAFGIRMGEPWHLVRPDVRAQVLWFSSNYELYGDMSRRMYQVLEDFFPSIEPYSIDEMFLDVKGLEDAVALSRLARTAVRQIAKIPTCVGIGPTKTIAKLANAVAKMEPNWGGVCDLSDVDVRQQIFSSLPLEEVWGMGEASARKVRNAGGATISDFVAMPTEIVRKLLTVTGLRTHAELKGQSCLTMASAPPPRKMLAVARSFGRVILDHGELRQAVATYAEIAARRLRAAGLIAAGMQVFVETNAFAPKDPQHSASRTFGIEAGADSRALVASALRALEAMWRPTFRYHKAGVVLMDLYPPQGLPTSLFPSRDPARSGRLMAAMDAITDRHGRGAVRIASTVAPSDWGMRRRHLSPRYTTAADELMAVHI